MEKYAEKIRVLFHDARAHLRAAALCAVFGAVYEVFSHGVYSPFMIYAFAIPLVLGALPLMSLGMLHQKTAVSLGTGKADSAVMRAARRFPCPGQPTLNVWSAGIATLTVGCIFQGVLEIFGTTNRLIIVYPVAAGILLAAGRVMYQVEKRLVTQEKKLVTQMEEKTL